MTAALTIILPHKRNKGNDAALRIALDCLYANTVNDFILISDAAYDQPLYPRVNAMVEQATTEMICYTTSDTFVAPGWDVPMCDAFAPDVFLTGVVVEPGAIVPHWENVHKDFGRKPETFDRAAFEAWCASGGIVPNGIGFPAPFVFPRAGFLAHGGLDETGLTCDHDGFTCADLALFDRWTAAGNRVRRVRSFFFHLQRWSEEREQMDAKRELRQA